MFTLFDQRVNQIDFVASPGLSGRLHALCGRRPDGVRPREGYGRPARSYPSSNDNRTFDSLLIACYGASVTLAGPALDATNSTLRIPFSVVSAIQGGRVTSSWPGR